MNINEIYNSLAETVIEFKDECKIRLESVPRERTTERKALQVELGMYSFCQRAGLLLMTETYKERGEAVIELRQNISESIMSARFPYLYDLYLSLDDQNKKIFLAVFQAEIFMRDQIFESYKEELKNAKACGDEDRAFEFKIKVSALERVFSAWDKWRKDYQLYPDIKWEV